MFAWGKEQGRVTLNVCEGLPRKKADKDDIRFVHVDHVEALFRRAEKVGTVTTGLQRGADGTYEPVPADEEDFRDFVPFLVLAFFNGLRPERELGEMEDMSDVHLDEGITVVRGPRAKTRARRVVELPENAVAWLRAFPRDGKVLPKNFARRWKRLRGQVKIGGGKTLFDEWPHDGARHTFATYHYAKHQNEAKLQVQMGHESDAVLHTNYRGLGRPKDAERFWGIMPLTKSL